MRVRKIYRMRSQIESLENEKRKLLRIIFCDRKTRDINISVKIRLVEASESSKFKFYFGR